MRKYQHDVGQWTEHTFGKSSATEPAERAFRFIEEALELVQAIGLTRKDALRVVEYVYGRQKGEPHQEVGGVMVTLAALCHGCGLDMEGAAHDELKRVWRKVDVIRGKNALKRDQLGIPGRST